LKKKWTATDADLVHHLLLLAFWPWEEKRNDRWNPSDFTGKNNNNKDFVDFALTTAAGFPIDSTRWKVVLFNGSV